MRLPFLPRRSDGPIRIPLAPTLNHGFGVYFRLRTSAAPTDAQLRPVVARWLQENGDEPLRSAVGNFIERGLLSLTVGAREMLPPPPAEVLRHFTPGEEEERRFCDATHLIVVSAADLLIHPPAGYWAAIATARALARAAGGVILDPAIPRLLPVTSHTERLPADPRVTVIDHIVVPVSESGRGMFWMTTKGMGRFGLPELELRDVPYSLRDGMVALLNGAAQQILAQAMQLASARGPRRELALSPELHLDLDGIAAAMRGHRQAGSSVRGAATVGLAYRPQKAGDSFLSLVPPGGVPSDPHEWLNSVAADLGLGDPVAVIRADDESMEVAHRRAISDLPAIKHRFQAGLPPGLMLYVRQAFATSTGGKEYMWIEVLSWDEGRIQGKLSNDGQYRLDLRSGAPVEMADAHVFDWMIARSDGSFEGGYTSRVLLRNAGR